MKKISFYLITILSILFLSACRRNDINAIDTTPPSPPTGIQVLNGNNQVDLYWNPNPEHNISGYNIYRGYSYNGTYKLIGNTSSSHFTDINLDNGTTYFYAVTALDFNGNESDLSKQNISSTPRPEGFNESVFDYRNFPSTAGFSFVNQAVVPYNDNSTDFYFETFNGVHYLDVYSDTYIEDMGQTNDIYDIPYAPNSGWSSTSDAVAIVGHTYVIWTVDNNYAKIRISNITDNRVVFDWAFQTVKGNTQLKVKTVPAQRNPSRTNSVIQR